MNNYSSIAQSFTNVARLHPQNIAVDDPISGAVSYNDFATLVFGFAHAILKIRQKSKVLIHLPQGTMAYAAMLGAATCGATYAPLNVDSPEERHKMIMDVFVPDVIISNIHFDTKIPILNPKLITPFDPLPIVESDAPSYVIFTSGSTGAPKGVSISRNAHAAYVSKWVQTLSISSRDRISQHPSIAFDLSVADIFGALTSGATLVPFSRVIDKMFPARTIKTARITVWNSTPSVVDFMSQAGDLSTATIPKLRCASFCGEPLLPHQAKAIFNAAPAVEVHNSYGPTEATVAVTDSIVAIPDLEQIANLSLSLGKPLIGNTIFLLGEDGKISISEGEILIVGDQLADGYWQDQERTSASFRMINLGKGLERAYFTGDIGRWVRGKLYFIQRKDHQVKIRGHRVELGAVAKAVSSVAGCNAIAVHLDDKIFVVIEGPELDSNGVQKILTKTSAILDRYAQPSGILAISHFPQNENDKIDLKAITRYALKKITSSISTGIHN